MLDILKSTNKPHSVIINYTGELDKDWINNYCKWLICKDNGCGVCNDCLRVVEGSYLDIKWAESTVSKAEVTQMINELSFSSIEECGVKIAIFNNAENLSHVVLNQLLKIVEEPPEKTYFVFITKNISKVISTIRSRSTVVNNNWDTNVYESDSKILSLLNGDTKSILSAYVEYGTLSTHDLKNKILQNINESGLDKESKNNLTTLLTNANDSVSVKIFIDQVIGIIVKRDK